MTDKNYNILYVDDEKHNLVAFKAAFRRYYSIFTAESAEEGLKILAEHEICLIITDQRMPRITGIEFLEKVIPQYPDTIRIILTGFSDVEAIIEAINTGQVFRYINKPWNEDELKMTIDNAIQLYGLQRYNRDILDELQLKINEQEKTLRVFQKFVPEEVVIKVLNASEDSILDGESREVTVLFCDIRGFTPLSERIHPKQVVDLLNAYYGMMTDIIKRHKGTVNQFVGDEVFACFGAPAVCIKSEQNAVFCALEMIHSLKKLNELFETKLGVEIIVGIGINAGEVIAGTVGSEERIDYCITGDTVNTGKRIETLTKEHPNSILISESVYNKVSDFFEVKAWQP
ncbi:MAG: adenylate/guanylate cyclase domain-containing protein, partial [Calditrichaceae bacterium]